jgi:hypothetical protein
MRIYVSHSRNFDFKKELYEPLENSGLDLEFIFPHKDSEDAFDSKSLFTNKGCDLVLAEGSYQSTGQGIELGWANILGVKIISIYKAGSQLSNSLKTISEDVIEYADSNDLINKLFVYFKQNIA